MHSSTLDQAAQKQVGDWVRLCDVGLLGRGEWGVGASTRGLRHHLGCPACNGHWALAQGQHGWCQEQRWARCCEPRKDEGLSFCLSKPGGKKTG